MARSRMSALLMILGVAVVGSTIAVTTKAARVGDYGFYDPIVDVHTMIDRLYVEEPDEEAVQQGAIEGMIEKLNDPYTQFVPTSLEEDFNKNLKGQYVGIGAEVIMRDGWLVISSPMDGSPAWRAGVMAEDRVLSIGDQSTYELTINECIDLLKGEPGTTVTINVERGGDELTIDIVRDHIKVQAVKGYMREDGGEGEWRYLIDEENKIAYVRLTQFIPGCAAEVRAAIEHATARAGGELGGLILDVRDNPGGLLDEAIAIADMLLEDGVIVSTKGRVFEDRVARATSAGTLPDFPMVTLVNGVSASASEILSGALSEHGRSVVVGTRSFGKGSVQTVRPLSSGAGVLKITEQYYYLPSGRLLHRRDDSETWGVDPTPGYYLAMSNDERLAMLTARREQEVIHETEAIDLGDTDLVLERLSDTQLSAAVRVLQNRVVSGAFEPVGAEFGDQDDIAYDELVALRRSEEQILRQLERIDRRITAIESNADSDGDDPLDLWDDSAEIVGGQLVVKDKDGNVIATLDITGENLERWLIDAGVEKSKDDGDESGS